MHPSKQEEYYILLVILLPISISFYNVTFLDHNWPELLGFLGGFFPLAVHLSDDNKTMKN